MNFNVIVATYINPVFFFQSYVSLIALFHIKYFVLPYSMDVVFKLKLLDTTMYDMSMYVNIIEIVKWIST